MIKKRAKSKYTLLFLCLFSLSNIFAQNLSHTLDSVIVEGYAIKMHTTIIDDSGLHTSIPLTTNNTITASIGTANMYDTYLSPLEYKGYSIHLMYEQMRRTTWFDYKFNKQQIIELEFAKGDSPAKNVTEYWGMLNYRLGGHYSIYRTNRLRLGIGGLWGVNAGVLSGR